MSDVQPQPGLLQQLRGRWQVPLLVIALGTLGAGLWRLKPAHQPPEFEPRYAHAVALHRAGLYPEAAGYIETLLAAPERTEAQKQRLAGLLAQVIFDHEQGNVVHGPTNSQRILDLTQESLPGGASFDGATLRMRAMAFEWLGKPALAVSEYREALAKGVADAWTIRRRILDIKRTMGDLDDATLQSECEAFLAGTGVDNDLAYWAAEQMVELLSRQKKFEEAQKFLAVQSERFRESKNQRGFDYLQALILFHTGRRDEADRVLRSIRDDLDPADPVVARAGLLLGRMLLSDEAPEYALAFFDDVLRQTPAGPLRWNAVLGRGEALDALERYDEALEAYGEAIRVATESPYDSPFDYGPVGADDDDLANQMAQAWRLPKVTRYFRTVARRAELTFLVGKDLLAMADQKGAGPEDPERVRGRAYLKRAGDYYERLAGLVVLDDEGAVNALLSAADAFDLAGENARTAEVLQELIRQNPKHAQVPSALLRLGQTFQSVGRFERAIDAYQQNLIQFPRTPAAIASLVPLAECFRLTGKADMAEQTLLRLIQHAPGDPLGLVTPAATQYRDALFSLAELYNETGQLEKAIARYEEVLDRYAEDARVERVKFMLAEAYRRSAEQVRAELAADPSGPFKDDLAGAWVRRLEQARRYYAETIEHYRRREPAELTALERTYLKLSYLYAADCALELASGAGGPSSQPSSDVLTLYEQAAWACAKDPIAMSAYVQLVNCHLRAGRQEKARAALQRARLVLRNIPEQAFDATAPTEGRAYWEDYLSWLEKTPTLATTRPAAG